MSHLQKLSIENYSKLMPLGGGEVLFGGSVLLN
jgi:hypothetical protein